MNAVKHHCNSKRLLIVKLNLTVFDLTKYIAAFVYKKDDT